MYLQTSNHEPTRLLYPKQLHIEDQRRVRRDDTASASRPVPQIGRDDEAALSADPHAHHSLIPSFDYLSAAESELKRVVAVARAIDSGVLRSPLYATVRGVDCTTSRDGI